MDATDSAHARMAEDAGEPKGAGRGGSGVVEAAAETHVRSGSSDGVEGGRMEGGRMEGEENREGAEELGDASPSPSSPDSRSSPSPPSSPPPWYDAEVDDRDERWMARERRKRGGRSSDAILSCPGCLSSVCFDCQRHERFITQYRAVFAVNCQVNTSQELRTPSGKDGGSKKRKGGGGKNGGGKEQQRTGGGVVRRVGWVGRGVREGRRRWCIQ
ncbi:hypothetical protein CLOP_g15430 [Closterium sp. NIES-67]|nr:hypothetical protein CLOP_g15430 [Closterium sp. NIES-67]